MRRYTGTQTVEPGIYVNLRQLHFKSMEGGEPLPGTTADTYRRVPWILLLFAGPLLGLTYVIFLPFIGLAMVAWMLIGKVGDFATSAARSAARVLTPSWEPSRAFLSKSKKRQAKDKEKDTWAEETRKKLEDPEHESE